MGSLFYQCLMTASNAELPPPITTTLLSRSLWGKINVFILREFFSLDIEALGMVCVPVAITMVPTLLMSSFC